MNGTAAHPRKPTPPSGHPSEEGMGQVILIGSDFNFKTFLKLYPHPLLGGVPRGRGGLMFREAGLLD
jgi:hypothetical protein